ncbi:M20 family metallopeptidase [Streptococcus sp. zg-JUN1979]|uniref:M20 family metallopeptidase n=1 Tax=Streptococcus sp. zg-JUN1979 TaxID=3391450 RepID=UPI0039A4BC85
MTFITEKQQKDCVEALAHLVSFASVLQEDDSKTPFGQPIQDALDYTLALAKSLGFRTYCDDKGYYGYAEVGEGSELLAVLCHLDVVPAGDRTKWLSNPFKMDIRDGKIYGRGVQDDKGPSMAALFAMKALLDKGVVLDKRVRFIFGTDEETLWRCMNRYNQREEQATMGFAPDSVFPLTYAEKGLLQVKLHGKGDASLSLECGDAFNVVPAKARYSGEFLEEVTRALDEHHFEYESQDDSVIIVGLAQHSKDAAKGINAIVRLAKVLSPLYDCPALSFISQVIGEDATGRSLFGDLSDRESGDLSINVAGLTVNERLSEIRLDIRIPVLADKEALVQQLVTKAADYQLDYEEYDYLAPLYVPRDSQLVETLMAVYREQTGDLSAPIASGGATFARTMPNCVAFGACFPNSPQTEHQENEHMALEDLYKAMTIYAEALYRLAAKHSE